MTRLIIQDLCFFVDTGCCVKASLAIMSCEKVTFGDLLQFHTLCNHASTHSEQLTKLKWSVYWYLWVTMAKDWQKLLSVKNKKKYVEMPATVLMMPITE